MHATDLVDFVAFLVVIGVECAALALVALTALRVPPIRRLVSRVLDGPDVEPGEGRDSVPDRLDRLLLRTRKD